MVPVLASAVGRSRRSDRPESIRPDLRVNFVLIKSNVQLLCDASDDREQIGNVSLRQKGTCETTNACTCYEKRKGGSVRKCIQCTT